MEWKSAPHSEIMQSCSCFPWLWKEDTKVMPHTKDVPLRRVYQKREEDALDIQNQGVQWPEEQMNPVCMDLCLTLFPQQISDGVCLLSGHIASWLLQKFWDYLGMHMGSQVIQRRTWNRTIDTYKNIHRKERRSR